MEFVFASIDDCKELSYLKKHIKETTYRGIYSDEAIDNYDLNKSEEKFRKYISGNDQSVYICKDNNEIIGYMVVGTPIYKGLEGYKYCINDLGIKENYRGKGIGTLFLNLLKEKQIRFYNACNYYNIKARKFYEAMGGKLVKTEMNDIKEYCQVYYVYGE